MAQKVDFHWMMKMRRKAKIQLSLPSELVRWVSAPWLKVSKGSPGIKYGSVSLPLNLAPGRTKAGIPLHTAPAFSDKDRLELENASQSYLDSVGHFHLEASNLFIHLEAKPSGTVEKLGRRGVATARLVQQLLQTEGWIALGALAATTRVSLGQVHKLLVRLEDQGLLETTGSGPSRRRRVASRSRLLDWTQRWLEPRLPKATRAFVYARTPNDLWRHLGRVLGREASITGAAGASLYGAGPTAVPITTVRLRTSLGIADALRRLETKATDAGANVAFVLDPGELAFSHATQRDGIQVAPPVRIYLDALHEPRGEDVAAHFRESILGY